MNPDTDTYTYTYTETEMKQINEQRTGFPFRLLLFFLEYEFVFLSPRFCGGLLLFSYLSDTCAAAPTTKTISLL